MSKGPANTRAAAAKQRQPRRYWESLSDDQLLLAELTIDDPESLENVVYELPQGDEEPYVEYKYDLRGTEREKLRCVHGNHPHLAGYVMRKGDKRFFVGHICGNHIYGEVFEQYTADFNAAVNRQEAVRRAREIKNGTEPFLTWLDAVLRSDIFKQYHSVRDQFAEHMPGLCDTLEWAGAAKMKVLNVQAPPTLFQQYTDPQEGLQKLATEFTSLALFLVHADLKVQMARIAGRMASLTRLIEAELDKLKEVEDFFQANALAAFCELATMRDNPKKRTYEPGLLSVTCKRDKNPRTVHMPRHYQLPNRKPIEDFRAALSGLQL